MSYPYEAGEAERFVPPALAHIENPPVFWLRWGTMREKARHRRIMDEEGLRRHDHQALFAELDRGVEALLSDDECAHWLPKIKSWRDAQDSFAEEHRDVPADDWPDFTFEDGEAIEAILNQIASDWRPYRLLVADNKQTDRMLPDIILSVIIDRFENLPDVQLEKYGQYLTLDCAMQVSEAMLLLAHEHQIPDDNVQPRTELNAECTKRLYLTKERVKNLESPPPSSPNPSDTKNGTDAKDGPSKASATSRKTRARSSRKTTTQ